MLFFSFINDAFLYLIDDVFLSSITQTLPSQKTRKVTTFFSNMQTYFVEIVNCKTYFAFGDEKYMHTSY